MWEVGYQRANTPNLSHGGQSNRALGNPCLGGGDTLLCGKEGLGRFWLACT